MQGGHKPVLATNTNFNIIQNEDATTKNNHSEHEEEDKRSWQDKRRQLNRQHIVSWFEFEYYDKE